ncbi:MAG: hypothetical protein WA628_03105 [Terriglobales bacterium]
MFLINTMALWFVDLFSGIPLWGPSFVADVELSKAERDREFGRQFFAERVLCQESGRVVPPGLVVMADVVPSAEALG